MLRPPVCGRRLKVGFLASFGAVPPLTDLAMVNITISQALADVECSGILGNLELEVIPAGTKCQASDGIQAFLNLMYEENVGIILGPECSVVGQLIGQVANFIKIPIFAHSTESATLSDRDVFSTYFRINQPGSQLTVGWQLLLKELNITKVSLVKEAFREFDEYVRQFENDIRNNPNITLEDSQTIKESDVNVETVLEHIVRANARVVIAQVYPKVARGLLCAALKKVRGIEICGKRSKSCLI